MTAQLTPPTPPSGTAMVVRAASYLVREQRFDGSAIFLWPADEAYVRDLVYDWEFRDGTYRIVRWDRGFVVTLDGELADDASIVGKTLEVIAEMNRVSGLGITLGPAGACVVSIDPSLADDNYVAKVVHTFRGASITGAKVLFVNRKEISGGLRADYPNTLLHEMGHVLGLLHSPNNRDVMTPAEGPGAKEAQFQRGEVESLHMMYAHRSAGNIFPDKDAALSSISSGPERVEIVDYRK
jgi:hypothetical protein